MIHKNRIFQIVEDVTSIALLAENLTQHTWTLCTAFKLVIERGAEPLLFLNDSFSENGAQEYAVIRAGRQIESITFSWCSRGQAHNSIAWLARGGSEEYGLVEMHLEPAETHSCVHCR